MTINQFLANHSRMPITAKIFLLQNLAVMIKAGVALADALTTLEEQSKNPRLKLILTEAVAKVRQGNNFSDTLRPYEKDFGEMFINMIAAGEASGRLEDVLNQLYIQAKKDHGLKTKIRNAMIYPVIIIVMMIGIGFFALFFILPNITSMFKDLNVQLPLATRILIFIGDFAQKNMFFIIIPSIIVALLLIRVSTTKSGKYFWNRLLLKIPVISGVIKQINISLFARSMSSLIKTDIAIVDTLKITSRVVSNGVYRKAIGEAAEKVKKGDKLAAIFKEYHQIFPPIIIQMIAVGEETGSLDEIMEKVSDFYDEEVSQTLNNLPAIIEPILMLLIGAGVATIAVAVIMPMYSLIEKF